MKSNFPLQNYEQTQLAIGYVDRKSATNEDYVRIGFQSGLEVHQQLKTQKKLFCHCPCGLYNDSDQFDAEIIRHMRPALSELGGYDGTALMEFKTRKNITYQIKNETACTYEIDDTPPFKINQEALDYALEIALLSNLNIVGEVHITRKQYLDGSIPTGFQRTAILGVEGEIQLKHKKVGLIQLSIEEDSCREVSDIAHERIYKTDRLGMPLIETVTKPELMTPDELREAAEYIRFLNRSTGKVRTGMGAGRQDVNVSCKGGTRVEIKGVAHNKWIPELSHNEAFRQWALLNVKKHLHNTIEDTKTWHLRHQELDYHDFNFKYPPLLNAKDQGLKIIAVNLPGFKGALSHFLQPGKTFATEFEIRLKVIACLERPNMVTSEDLNTTINPTNLATIQRILNADAKDAQIIFWGPEADIKTALETIEERCQMAFEGIPSETRKALSDGTTFFERVLPGADRMYPDTDSAPIPLTDAYINTLKTNLPVSIHQRFNQLAEWKVPDDTHHYILRNNLVPVLEKIIENFEITPKFLGTFFGHLLKSLEGRIKAHSDFNYQKVYHLFHYIHQNDLDVEIAKSILPIIFEHPNMAFESILTSIKFRKRNREDLLAPLDYLLEKFKEINRSKNESAVVNWIMGQLRKQTIGNMAFRELRFEIEKRMQMHNQLTP